MPLSQVFSENFAVNSKFCSRGALNGCFIGRSGTKRNDGKSKRNQIHPQFSHSQTAINLFPFSSESNSSLQKTLL